MLIKISTYSQLLAKNVLEIINTNLEDEDVSLDEGTFQLPKNIGYSEDGIILLYNTYEIAPYSTGIIEFVIPFEEVNSLLIFKSS